MSELSFLPTCCWSRTLNIIFNNLNSSISSIPNSTRPSSSSTKNLHLTTLSLCLVGLKKYLNVLCLNCYLFLNYQVVLLHIKIVPLSLETNI